MRHWFDFGPSRALVSNGLNNAAAWDALRIEGGGGFRIATDRREHERLAQERVDVRVRMAALADWVGRNAIDCVVSYGVGAAVAEYWLQRFLPDLTLVLTEAGPRTCARLKLLFPDVSVLLHDLRTDAPVPGGLQLFHRLDTEFSNEEWRAMLSRFAGERIMFVATETLTWRRAIIESIRALQPGTTTAGWLRNRTGFESFLGAAHEYVPLTMGDLPTWLLTPRDPAGVGVARAAGRDSTAPA